MLVVLAALAFVGSLAGLVVVAVRYRAEQRECARVRALFSRYLAPPIVEELLRRKDPRLYTGRSLHATIVVCRIWNFAGFAETLSAEETLRYLNEFFALAGTSIQKHRGMIDKFLADGIIGVFGVPLEDPDAEEHALRAALDIVRLVDAMDRRWSAQDRRSFQIGIGINSGEVIAGDAGFHERREFTVVGPETLFAGRLQEATETLCASIVAAATTINPVRHLFSVVPLSGHPLPGLRRLADAFVVLGTLRDSAPLAMPAAGTFQHTQVERAPAAAAPDDAARVAPPLPGVPAFARVDVSEARASLDALRRSAELAADTAFALPERRRAHFDAAADLPVYPELPAPRAAYEDRQGPPIELPP